MYLQVLFSGWRNLLRWHKQLHLCSFSEPLVNAQATSDLKNCFESYFFQSSFINEIYDKTSIIPQLVESAKELKYYKHRRITRASGNYQRRLIYEADLANTSASKTLKASFEIHLFTIRLKSFEDFHLPSPQE